MAWTVKCCASQRAGPAVATTRGRAQAGHSAQPRAGRRNLRHRRADARARERAGRNERLFDERSG